MRVPKIVLNARTAAAVGVVLIAAGVVGVLVLAHMAKPVTASRLPSPGASSQLLPQSPAASLQPPPQSPGASRQPPQPAYQFSPAVSAGSPPEAVHLVAADLNGNRQIAASFSVSGPGTVSLHGFGSIASLSACIEYGQGCTPGPVPNPASWAITGDDIAHVGVHFAVHVNLAGGLAGIDVGWNGPHALTLSNVGMNGSANGYSAGAGVRYRVATGGTVSVSAGAGGGFHLKAQDKATGTVVPATGDIGFSGSSAITLVPAATWTIYLWSGTPVTASPSLTWP